MLAIRMQRTGRKGHAMFRVVVQEARLTPTSGKVVALLGSYNPHQKVATFDKAKAEFYLKHGAQPSDRAARLLKEEGVDLPKWVKSTNAKSRTVRNPEKLRRNNPQPQQAPATETATQTEAAPAEPPADDGAADDQADA